MPHALNWNQLATSPDTREKMHNTAMSPVNRCHQCGATSYKPVIKRDETGTMRPSGEYKCVGCQLTFTDIEAWKLGSQEPLDRDIAGNTADGPGPART